MTLLLYFFLYIYIYILYVYTFHRIALDCAARMGIVD